MINDLSVTAGALYCTISLFVPTAVECPSVRTNCLGIVSAENCMCVKVVHLKPMTANPALGQMANLQQTREVK
jgi:hypothetical protein